VLTRATTDLNRIDYRALNADARTQYDTAKRFVTQAQEALRAKIWCSPEISPIKRPHLRFSWQESNNREGANPTGTALL
jgi:hypothetical protein